MVCSVKDCIDENGEIVNIFSSIIEASKDDFRYTCHDGLI